MMILVTGGSGCGKSHYAERLLHRLGAGRQLVYIATMDAYDEECRARVARHRAQRQGMGFLTFEQPTALHRLEVARGCAAILECVPTLLAGEMFSPGGDPDTILLGIKQLQERCDPLVIVTNDVFSDGIRYDPSTEDYRAKLAHINRAIACLADRVVEVVYSIPVAVKGELL